MQRKILVFDLCTELEQELVRQQLNPDTLKRYRKVLKEFSVFGGEEVYSQPLGTEFLIQKFMADGGMSITDEHSRTEAYYYKCIRILAEYYNFGIVHIRNDFKGEVIWPDGFRDAGWALIDYIKAGRPITESPNIFVKHRQPYDAFPVNSTMNHILSAVLAKAGIASDSKNYGWHTFRRPLWHLILPPSNHHGILRGAC